MCVTHETSCLYSSTRAPGFRFPLYLRYIGVDARNFPVSPKQACFCSCSEELCVLRTPTGSCRWRGLAVSYSSGYSSMPTRIRRGIVTIHGPRSKMVPSLLFSKLLFITAFSGGCGWDGGIRTPHDDDMKQLGMMSLLCVCTVLLRCCFCMYNGGNT